MDTDNLISILNSASKGHLGSDKALEIRVAAFNNPVLSAYYQKKRAEGKHHYTAIGAVARKLLYITFAVLTRNQPYTPIA